MIDISIIIPGIRQPRWLNLYKSCFNACKKYEWEIVISGPFEPLEEELKTSNKLQWYHTWSNPSIATQLATTLARGKILFFSVDDCVFAENSLDQALDLYNNSIGKTVINGRYTENSDHMPRHYWKAGSSIHLLGVNPDWELSLQPILSLDYFKKLGGLDCRFEYSNHGFHDLMFRIQKDGGQVLQSPTEICIATWYKDTTGDHAPIHHAQIDHDTPLFNELYKETNNRIKIDFNNHKQYPLIWQRRFNKDNLPKSYSELYPDLS